MRGLGRRRGGVWHRAWTSFPNEHSGTRGLLFQLQHVLGKGVDLGVEFIDLPFQREHFAWRRRRLRCLAEYSGNREKKKRAESERLHSKKSDICERDWQARKPLEDLA